MKVIVISAIVILGVFLAVLSQIPLGIEPLTELYFENHTELPKHIFLDKDYGFIFTMRNLEYRDMDYEYTISAGDEILGTGVVPLKHEEQESVSHTFAFGEHFEKSKISIEITKVPTGEEPKFKSKLWWPDPNYPEKIDIHFWVEEIVGPTITIVPD